MLNSSVPLAIVFFGNDWSAENRTSSHHIARWLARQFPVYYIECPGLRCSAIHRPRPGKDCRQAGPIHTGSPAGAEEPPGRDAAASAAASICLRALAERPAAPMVLAPAFVAQWDSRIHHMVHDFPHLASVMNELGERRAVYYCIDDYASLPDVNPQAVRALDEESTRKADLVFVASETLLAEKRRLNPRTVVSPHGVDLKHFGSARDPLLAVSTATTGLPRPIVGFFGLIECWIDLDLIDWLAGQRPQWTFLMIGRVAVPPAELPSHPNIHFLGKRPYDELPAYGKLFDAAIIPYRPTRQVYHANPIKLREYLAMGKPIVSVSTPEIDKYADVVEIARSREVFLAKLDEALSRPDGLALQRLTRVSAEGWDARLEKVLECVATRPKVSRYPDDPQSNNNTRQSKRSLA